MTSLGAPPPRLDGSARGHAGRPTSSVLDEQIRAELEGLADQGLYRMLRRVTGTAGPRMEVDGRDCLMLASSNYLDLAGHPEVVAAAHAAAASYGTAAGGSRLINGNLALHEALERDLARFCGFESALVYSTGYMANLGVLTTLATSRDVVVSDELNHASIIDGCRLSGADTRIFRHRDPEDLARVLAACGGYRRRLLVLDGVFSMDGDTSPLADLVPIAREHEAVVVVDDAHGIGVLGATGRGTIEQEQVAVDVLVGNLGKALGSFGAFVGCSATVRDLLVNSSRSFVFTCAVAPPALGAAGQALRIIEREPDRRDRLRRRAEALRSGLRDAGYDTGLSSTHVVPAIVHDSARAMSMAQQALARGVYAQGIRYPSVPVGAARIRFTPSAGHSDADIAEVVDVFAQLREAVVTTP
ncbi:MAG: 8-amino-7-oxononanoate synthase [Acidimicrobiales bacterium]|nr:8-amino-7-oxononanoate synthase [Acidimicrobiales bacterium]